MRFGFNPSIFKSYRDDCTPFRIPESKPGLSGRHIAMTSTGLVVRQARRRPSPRNLGKR
jgi:hypothetical protein